MIFYFFIIRPQSKKYKEHQNLIQNLKIGNLVILNSGIFGKIKSISNKEPVLDVEIADDVIVKIQKNSVLDIVKNEKVSKKAEKKVLNDKSSKNNANKTKSDKNK